MKPGDGPCHVALHPRTDTIYVVNEISLTVAVLRPKLCGRANISICHRKDLLADMSSAEGASADAIRVLADGRFLHASVRFPGDKIVGFSLNLSTGDIINKLGEWSSHGVHPRAFFVIEQVLTAKKCASFWQSSTAVETILSSSREIEPPESLETCHHTTYL